MAMSAKEAISRMISEELEEKEEEDVSVRLRKLAQATNDVKFNIVRLRPSIKSSEIDNSLRSIQDELGLISKRLDKAADSSRE